MIPWGHHRFIIDKCKGDSEKAWFYASRTIEQGWSRNVLLNMLSTDLYEREGKAQTNFELTLPKPEGDLAMQLVKDPQVFEVLGLEKEYQEADLKKALVASIEKTILSFGRGVAFMGSEYPVELGGEEKLIDLLFYVVPQCAKDESAGELLARIRVSHGGTESRRDALSRVRRGWARVARSRAPARSPRRDCAGH